MLLSRFLFWGEENEVSFETLFSKETTLEMQGVLLPWAFTNLCLIYMNVLPWEVL